MYCYHCGKEVDTSKAFAKKHYIDASNAPEGASLSYVCPRCGHLMYDHGSEEDVKSLSRAAHAQVQRGSNSFAKGMWMVSVGVILGVISFLFFLLSRRTKGGVSVIVTDQSQFWVCVVLGVLFLVLVAVGSYYAITGAKTRRKYLGLLKDIANGIFVQ